jgi:two-component system, NarL family, sensor histidine kinase UhpB
MGWRTPLSIRTRLNILIGALLVLALAANVLAIVWSAGPRIRAEDESILRLTRQTVQNALAHLPPEPAQDSALAALIASFNGLRHVRVYRDLESASPGLPIAANPQAASGGRSDVPTWFAKILDHDRALLKIKVPNGAGFIVIAASPDDEITEIWQSVIETLSGGLALIAAVFALTTLAVHQALSPIDTLAGGLKQLEGGDYQVRVETVGPPELADIARKLNTLAAALEKTRIENARLAEQLIWVSDDERRELARELHDEFGPYLFSIRATLSALQAEARRDPTPAGVERGRKYESLLYQVSEVQLLNRRVLQRLRPPALADLGLTGALHGLVDGWRAQHRDVEISLEDDGVGAQIDDTTALTVYRVVQEGLTNAFRHAGATKISIRISQPMAAQLAIDVQDNGQGLSADIKPGMGLSGMSERVWALGGTLAMTNARSGGLALRVELPLIVRN